MIGGFLVCRASILFFFYHTLQGAPYLIIHNYCERVIDPLSSSYTRVGNYVTTTGSTVLARNNPFWP